jgi:SAM-dependent methyltransferase
MTPYEPTSHEPTPHTLDAAAWQESWDRQQEAYMPDREERIAAMLDVVEAVAESPEPRLLDLAGGTGSITLRALARFPRLRATIVDLDPVLLTIAEATLLSRMTDPAADQTVVLTADLNEPSWTAGLPHRPYDAVVTATAMHWIRPERLTVLYGEIRDVLRPGGVFINADHLPDDALPLLTARLLARAEARRTARFATGTVLSWADWWQRAATDPVLAPLVRKRAQIYAGGHSAEWNPPAAWHVETLRQAGFREAGLIWRGGTDAAVAALR